LRGGETAVEIGTANFIDPTVTIKVIEGIQEYLDRHNIADIHDIIGII
jgi:dihydroorotate dehydrogenase (NAD+) catalytic subunit